MKESGQVSLATLEHLQAASPVEDAKHSILNNEFQKYGALAMLYANWYNYTVFGYLEENELARCQKQDE